MISYSSCNKMVKNPKAKKTVQDGLEALGAKKGAGKAFQRVLGDPTACRGGIKR
jgi:hypothetical protein